MGKFFITTTAMKISATEIKIIEFKKLKKKGQRRNTNKVLCLL